MRTLLLVILSTSLAFGVHAEALPVSPPAAPPKPAAVVAPAEPTPPAAVTPTTATLCGALEAAARKDELPLGFFTRLIWQESRMNPAARSPAGAQGVAQFMPATAGERGLLDPFEPTPALEESAGYLKDLH